MNRIKINGRMNVVEIVEIMMEGNPGAFGVLCEMSNAEPYGLLDVMHLDDMNMRGPQIWVGYKDVCNQDMKLFVEKVKARDAEMIRLVNEEMDRENFPHRAVTSGGSRAHGGLAT